MGNVISIINNERANTSKVNNNNTNISILTQIVGVFATITAWILNSDASAVVGYAYKWDDDEIWTDANVWKD